MLCVCCGRRLFDSWLISCHVAGNHLYLCHTSRRLARRLLASQLLQAPVCTCTQTLTVLIDPHSTFFFPNPNEGWGCSCVLQCIRRPRVAKSLILKVDIFIILQPKIILFLLEWLRNYLRSLVRGWPRQLNIFTKSLHKSTLLKNFL